MGIELKILRLFCSDRVIHDKYSKVITEIKNVDREIKLLFNLVGAFYEHYIDAEFISIDDLTTFYEIQYPISRDKEVHTLLIKEVFSVEINNVLAQDLLEQMMERHFASQMVNKLIPVVEGNKYGVLPSLKHEFEGFIELMTNPPVEAQELVPNTVPLGDMIDELNNEGLGWHIKELDNIIGRVKRKTFGLMYAFVDTGKTSFGMAAAASFARQLVGTDECIVYAGNEEAGNRLNLRLTQALLNITRGTLLQNPEKYTEERLTVGFDKVHIFDQITSIKHIERLMDMYHPYVVFVDQSTNIEHAKNERDIEATKSLFREYRNLTKQYNCSIIGLTQGTGDAENKKWLKLSDIYGSRVAIQGALDYGIGIGRIIDDASKDNQRFLNVSKNKLLDGEGGKIVTVFHRDTCKWEQV